MEKRKFHSLQRILSVMLCMVMVIALTPAVRAAAAPAGLSVNRLPAIEAAAQSLQTGNYDIVLIVLSMAAIAGLVALAVIRYNKWRWLKNI